MAVPHSPQEYRDGQNIPCEKCGKSVRVKWFPNKQLVVVPVKEREELALRCKACGFITCDACAHPNDSFFPVCPSCKLEMGPYYFIGSSVAETNASVAPDEPAAIDALRSLGNWSNLEQSMQMDFPQDEVVAADEEPQEVEEPTQESPTWLKRAPFLQNLFRRDVSPRPAQQRSPLMLFIFIAIGGILALLLFALSQLPAFLSSRRVIQPTSKSATQQTGIPANTQVSLVDGKSVSLTGRVLASPASDECAFVKDNLTWCNAYLEVEGEQEQIVLRIRRGEPMNAITRSREFLAKDGTLMAEGSIITVDGSVTCEAESCAVWVESIAGVNVITSTPLPTSTATPSSATPTSTEISTATPKPVTPTITPTSAPTDSGCKDALAITASDIGQTLCVQGVVVRTLQEGNAFIIFFSEEKGTFQFLLYDRVPKNIEPGACVRATGKISQPSKTLVLALKFKDPLEICP